MPVSLLSERGKQERQNKSRGSMRTQPNVAGSKMEAWGRGPRAVDGFWKLDNACGQFFPKASRRNISLPAS